MNPALVLSESRELQSAPYLVPKSYNFTPPQLAKSTTLPNQTKPPSPTSKSAIIKKTAPKSLTFGGWSLDLTKRRPNHLVHQAILALQYEDWSLVLTCPDRPKSIHYYTGSSKEYQKLEAPPVDRCLLESVEAHSL